jgi:hypothetical protein
VTQVKGSIRIERFPGDNKFVRLLRAFRFYSDVLGRWCTIPRDFIYDEESIPLFKGTNPEAGAAHDYLCRSDSDPVVTGYVAAQVYDEIQAYFDNKEPGTVNRAWDFIRRKVKTWAVVALRATYFHKHKVMDTYGAFQ